MANSNVVTSNPDSLEVLVAGGTTQASYTANTPIVYSVVIKDVYGAYNNTTGVFTAPSTGFYVVTASAGGDPGNNAELYAYVNGILAPGTMSVSIAGGVVPSGAVTLYLEQGDEVYVGLTTTWTISDAQRCNFSISRIK